MSHLGLIAALAALAAFVIYTSRPRKKRPAAAVAVSTTPFLEGRPFTATLLFPASLGVADVRAQLVCYSAVRTVLLKRWSSRPFVAERDLDAPPDVQRFVARGMCPSEAELWAYDVDPRERWLWRIDAAGRIDGEEWSGSFEMNAGTD